MALDPIQLEVLWNRLLSVANEQQTTLVRTAFSTIVRESLDLACGVFSTRGQMIGQSLTGTPGHINPMATGAIHFLEAYPPDTLEPGDVLVTNDPWQTAGQVNDFTVLTPVFRGSRIVAYFANCCHAPDIGGRILSAEAREVYEEGLRVPITKLFRSGEPNRELFKILRANVRTPDETVGDLYAQTSSNAVGARSLLQMMDEFGLDTIDPLADEIISRSENALRDALEQVPNGCYRHRVWSDGFEEPLRLEVTVTVEDRDIWDRFRRLIQAELAGHQRGAQLHQGLRVLRGEGGDQPGGAAQRRLLPPGPHHGAGRVDPELQRAGGGGVPAPGGALPARLDLRRPGPGDPGPRPGRWRRPGMDEHLARDLAGYRQSRELHPLPARRHRRPADQGRLEHHRLSLGGRWRAGRGHGIPGADRPDATRPALTDSGGAGAFRGGLGQATDTAHLGREPWSVSGMVDRTKFAAHGLRGGLSGAPGELEVNGEPAAPKTIPLARTGRGHLHEPARRWRLW